MKGKLELMEKADAVRPVSHAATVEEALTVTGFGKYNLCLLLVCTGSLQAMGLDMFGSSFTVAAAVCDLHLTLQQQALLTGIPLAGAVLGAQLWGYVCDARGRRLTLVVSMAAGAVLGSCSSLAPGCVSMAVLKLLSATFTSASNSGAYTLVGECCDARSRGRAMLLCTCALMCCQAVAAVITYPILLLDFSYPIEFLGINYRPWRLLVLALYVPCLLVAYLLTHFEESPKFLASKGRYEEALDVLKRIYACNTGKGRDEFPIKKLIPEVGEEESSSTEGCSFFGAMWRQTAALFRPPLLTTTLQLYYLVAVIYMTGSGFLLWLPYIMNNLFAVLETGGGQNMNLCSVIAMTPSDDVLITENNATLTEVCNDTIQNTTLISSIIYGSLAMCANLVLSLTAGSRKRLAMLCILTVSSTSALLVNLVPVPLAGVMFYFFFVMSALSMGILSVYFVELYSTSVRGMAACLSVMVGRSSAFIGVNAIGALLVNNCEATFYGWSILLLSAFVFTWFLPRDKDPQK
ncbi:unnamed protein product [Plutella xylostella]|uniref:(diamondback moth) hypothetical protein n=1 Tax=Plutella xylostella TaxID=51655 RepID=A0A8S4EY41_PLUXY|nr:unnamed protein product [Plutella xylostella]